MRSSDLLSLREAAIALRCTRRHLADLCARGLLPYVVDGAHTRIRRADVEALVEPVLTQAQLEQLWLHCAIAGKFVADPSALLGAATSNVRRLRRLALDRQAQELLERWQVVLDSGPEAVLEALTSTSSFAVEMRHITPFIGILSEVERRAVLDALSQSPHRSARPRSLDTVELIRRAV